MDVKSKDGIVLFNIPFLSICIWCLNLLIVIEWLLLRISGITQSLNRIWNIPILVLSVIPWHIWESVTALKSCITFYLFGNWTFTPKYDYILGYFKLRNWSNIIFTIDNAPFLYLFIRLLQNATLILWLRCCVDLH